MREAQDLSQILLRDTRYRVHICVSAHPLTNKDNARELNPFLTGVGIHGFVSESTLFNGEVGMGEEIHGSVDFDIAENKKHFFFLRMKSFVKTGRSSPPPLTDMFFPISLYTPHVFSPPTVSSLSSLGNFFLGSFAKDPGESAVLERLCRAGIDSQLIPDPHRVWSNYNNYQLFSSFFELSQDFVHKLLYTEGNEVSPNLGRVHGILTCDHPMFPQQRSPGRQDGHSRWLWEY